MIQDHKFLKPFSLHTNSATLFLVVRIGNELFFLTYAFPSKKRKDFNRCLIIWSLVAGPDRGRAVNVTAKLIQIQTAPEIKHTCHVSLSLVEQQRRRLSSRFGGDGAGGGGGGGGAAAAPEPAPLRRRGALLPHGPPLAGRRRPPRRRRRRAPPLPRQLHRRHPRGTYVCRVASRARSHGRPHLPPSPSRSPPLALRGKP